MKLHPTLTNVCCLALFAFFFGLNAQAESTEPSAQVTGVASYRERIAVPPGAQLEVVLADVSRMDAPSETLGKAVQENVGQPPYAFAIPYQPERIIPSHRYAVRARLTVGSRLLFTTVTMYPVITNGNPSDVKLMLKHVGR